MIRKLTYLAIMSHEIKRYITNFFAKVSARLKEGKKKIPLNKEQRNWENRTMGGERGSYTELDFEVFTAVNGQK